jgi:hypothetical protein
MENFTIGSRVTRLDNSSPVRGTILDIRTESFIVSLRGSTIDSNQLIISVLWDNGTRSVMTAKSLKLIE